MTSNYSSTGESVSLAVADDAPRVGELNKEFQRCGTTGNYLHRVEGSEAIRLALWDGQSDDGLKHAENIAEGKNVFPWEGASDARVFLADSVTNENVAVKTAAFWRAELRVQGERPETLGSAATATAFIDWLINSKLRRRLMAEVALAAQFEEGCGYTGLHVTWEREVGMQNKIFKMEEIMQLAQQLAAVPPEQMPPEEAAQAQMFAKLPFLILDPELEDAAVEVVKSLFAQFVQQNLPEGVQFEELQKLSTTRSRQAVRSLRNNRVAELPMPFLARNEPSIIALKPWRDIIFPPETMDIQKARVIFIRQFMTEWELLAMERGAGWYKDWIDAAIKTKGKTSLWSQNNNTTSLTYSYQALDQRTDLVEVVWAYRKTVDEDGVAGVQYTVFCPHVGSGDSSARELCAQHGSLDYPHGDYPVCVNSRELLDRPIQASRSTPEILRTTQQEEKRMRDGLADLASLAVVPPINIPKGTMGQMMKFGPAVQNMVTPGREPTFMHVPTGGMPLALEHIKSLRSEVDIYFGRFSAQVPAQLSQLMMEPKVRAFLQMWADALWQAWQLASTFAPDLIKQVTGDTEFKAGPGGGEYDFVLHFDVGQLHPDLQVIKMKAFMELVPTDAGGVIDRAKLTQVQARMIDPVLAREIVQPVETASAGLFKKIHDDVLGMAAGNEAQYADASNDPAAPTKMQYFQQIVQANPKYQQALSPQGDGLFQQLMKKYAENLQQGEVQQQNKQVGRIGVRPMNQNTQQG